MNARSPDPKDDAASSPNGERPVAPPRGPRIPGPTNIPGTLFLLLLIVLVPGILVQTGVYYERLQTRRSEELQANLEVARGVAATFDAFVRNLIGQELVLGLAAIEPGPPRPEQRATLLARSAGEHPAVHSISWVSPSGEVAASSAPELVGKDLSGLQCFREVVAGREWNVSNLTRDFVPARVVFGVARAIRGAEGMLHGVVVTIVDADRLFSVLPVARASHGAIGVVDGEGALVYRFPEVRLAWEERRLRETQPEVNRAVGGAEVVGTFYSPTEGETAMVALTPIGPIGWVAIASRPESEVMGPIYQRFFRDMAMLLSIATVSALAAVLVSRRLTDPVHRLRDHAIALGAGDLTRRATVDGLSELQQLAEAFNRMAEELRQREDELRRANSRLAQATADALAQTTQAERRAAQLEATIESTDAQLALLDGQYVILLVNSAFAAASGYDKRELLGRDYFELFPSAHLRQVFDNVRASGESYHGTEESCERGGRAAKLVGYWNWSLAPIRNPHGEVEGFLLSLVDVTPQVRARQRMEELAAEARWRTAELDATINAIAEGLVVFDAEGNLRRANATAARLLGAEALQGVSSLAGLADALRFEAPEGRPLAVDETPPGRALRGETLQNVVIVAHCPERDRPTWLSVSAAPVRGWNSSLTGVVVTFIDVTVARELEREREEFLRVISHDLRHPLTIIQGQAQMLKRSLDRPPSRDRLEASIEAILTSTGRMASMLRDLVDMARLDAGQLALTPRPLDLPSYIRDLITRMVGTVEANRLQVDMPDALPPVRADADRLERVLLNLLTNALKYSPAGTPVAVRAVPQEREVEITVADRGPGIPPDELPHLFHRYYRTRATRNHRESLGLGLYIAKGIVDAHGGRIWAESTLGVGSTFHFTLPRADVAPAPD